MVMHNANVPILNEDIYKLVHTTRDIDTENGRISVLIAFINALVNANLEKNYDQPRDHSYWGCRWPEQLYRDSQKLTQKLNVLNARKVIIGLSTAATFPK